MQVGRKVKVPDTWALGPKNNKNTTSYKYLGDVTTNDGENKSNIETRFKRTQGIIRQINTTAGSEIMRNIETKTILQLYETCILPSFLNNAESWTLLTTEENELDKLGIRILKRLFNLPEKTPSPAIMYSFGTLYMTQQIDQIRFMYLHKILRREDEHWTKKMLYHLKSIDLGWSKNINSKLSEYELERDWEKIKSLSKGQWKSAVKIAVQMKNKQKLMDSCKEQTPQGIKIKTKTAYIYDKLLDNSYTSEPLPELQSASKVETKTIVLSRSGMLMCGKNFKATTSAICMECQETDDEDHRLNVCSKWQHINFVNDDTNTPFSNVHSGNREILAPILSRIQKVWELHLGNGSMKKPTPNSEIK